MIVFGRLSADTKSVSDRRIALFALTLRHELPIGEARTDATGKYRIEVEHEVHAIRVRAYADDPVCEGQESSIADSGEICRPGEEVRVDLVTRGPSEVEKLLQALEPLRDG